MVSKVLISLFDSSPAQFSFFSPILWTYQTLKRVVWFLFFVFLLHDVSDSISWTIKYNVWNEIRMSLSLNVILWLHIFQYSTNENFLAFILWPWKLFHSYGWVRLHISICNGTIFSSKVIFFDKKCSFYASFSPHEFTISILVIFKWSKNCM